MSQITCVLYQILLAWLFKSCGDNAPIPLKNSEIVNRRNNKQQNVKISGNVLVQLFRSFCSIYKMFTKKLLNYSVSTREQVFPLKKYHQRWKQHRAKNCLYTAYAVSSGFELFITMRFDFFVIIRPESDHCLLLSCWQQFVADLEAEVWS